MLLHVATGPPASKVTSVTKVAPIAAVEEEEEEEVLPRAVTQPSPALTPPSPPTTPHYSPITPHYPTITHHYPTITHPSPLPKACQPTKVWLGWWGELPNAMRGQPPNQVGITTTMHPLAGPPPLHPCARPTPQQGLRVQVSCSCLRPRSTYRLMTDE